MFSDTHLHSFFSFDSEMGMEEAVKAAAAKGLSSITFTDHFDYDYRVNNDTIFDIGDFFSEYDNIKEPFEKKYGIKIFRGIEVGIQPVVMQKTYQCINKYNFDQIICSTHVVDGMDPYDGNYFTSGEKKARYGLYLRTLTENLEYYKSGDVFAHFDYLVRYAPYEDKVFRYSDFPDMLDMILKFVIENGLAFEINTSTYGRVSLDKAVLARYRELGGELISLGSDAHTAANIGNLFAEYASVIKDSGFDYLVHYEHRKAFYEKI